MGYDAVLAETVGIRGAGGDLVEAYTARPMAPGPRGGVVVVHHLPGYDRENKEFVRRFAVMGYDAICVNLYSREAPGLPPAEAAKVSREAGWVPDERFAGDASGAARWLRDLPTSNGKVGLIGHCSGGRQSILAAAEVDVDAVVDCYGGFVVEDPPEGLPKPMVPLRHRIPDITAPVLGLFGNDDAHPSPAHVDELEKLLQDNGKTYEFHRYDGAGHSFFSVDRPAYRVEAALDGWERIETWFGTHLSG
ncbi:dienelactone hydrolase family protein [Pseudonocardia ailaonensis]|uniref:Dienelactone hydrolase family protein n=1 Tax=Pseudonocardia ailaonensis TaxID=367279 RepID=A0ABN2ML58_9PSEU